MNQSNYSAQVQGESSCWLMAYAHGSPWVTHPSEYGGLLRTKIQVRKSPRFKPSGINTTGGDICAALLASDAPCQAIQREGVATETAALVVTLLLEI